MEVVMTVLVVVIGLILFAGLLLVAYGTVRKNRWGINLEKNHCPRCKCATPQVRVPKSTTQAMWGGSTCEKCGCEFDKWGREVAPGQ